MPTRGLALHKQEARDFMLSQETAKKIRSSIARRKMSFYGYYSVGLRSMERSLLEYLKEREEDTRVTLKMCLWELSRLSTSFRDGSRSVCAPPSSEDP
jgi:Holliday junction resolvasome RuvABC ATP-dependent DNA helicase subunit